MIVSNLEEQGIGTSKWPAPTLRHLQRLTDGCGIVQHAKFICPDYATGYCTDDNSRALIAVTRYDNWIDEADAQELMVRYLSFLRFTQRADGSMRNFVSYSREILEEGSQDCLGQTIWALGEAAACEKDFIAKPAAEMFRLALSHVTADFSPNALAYTLLGLCAYGQRDSGSHDLALRTGRQLANALIEHYQQERTDSWEWYAPILTYANARLPQSILHAATLLGDEKLQEVGLRTLDFLRKETVIDGILSPIGCHGWYRREQARAEFDQQPIDAGAMAEACLTAFKMTGLHEYKEDALLAMEWFYGRNVHGLSLYDFNSGGCHDGLQCDGVNVNQGAESTIVHLLAQLALIKYQPNAVREHVRINL